MDGDQSPHLSRIERLLTSFTGANDRLMARLRGGTGEAVERGQGSAWSAAQIGWHVAAVTTRFAGIMSGEIPAAQALPEEFVERLWPHVLASIPDRLEAPAATAPPSAVRREDALAALEASGIRMSRAIESLTPERGARMGITHPLVGTISVYQIGDWAIAHIIRHNRQAKRVLGQG